MPPRASSEYPENMVGDICGGFRDRRQNFFRKQPKYIIMENQLGKDDRMCCDETVTVHPVFFRDDLPKLRVCRVVGGMTGGLRALCFSVGNHMCCTRGEWQ